MAKIDKTSEIKRGDIIIYKTAKNEVDLSVRLEKETIWLTQKQIATLFGKGVPTINEHIKSIFKEGELRENSVIRKSRITASDGKMYSTNFYNLDVVLSVGYRVNSKRATQFRIWATKTLRQYLVKGYAINEKRLVEAREKFKELQVAIRFLEEKSKKELLTGQGGEVLSLLASYAKTLTLLDEYDNGKIRETKGVKSKFVLTYENCARVIEELKKELSAKGEAGELFGQERGGSFEGIINGLYQTFGGKELYSTIEDKASHILYLIIKDHPFSDGNKRSGAFLFVYFLDKSEYLYRQSGERKISDTALTALALLIAESDPKEKEVMVKIIKNLISEK